MIDDRRHPLACILPQPIGRPSGRKQMRAVVFLFDHTDNNRVKPSNLSHKFGKEQEALVELSKWYLRPCTLTMPRHSCDLERRDALRPRS